MQFTPDYLKSILDYNPNTGKLVWKTRPNGPKAWNTKFAGKEAGHIVQKNILKHIHTYHVRMLQVNGQSLAAHRVIWAIFYGAYPKNEIDHIDGNSLNNCINNLRCVGRIENARNQRIRTNNSSGVIGVSWDKQTSSWSACIVVHGKNIRIGRFKDLISAYIARKKAEKTYKFHENHGRK